MYLLGWTFSLWFTYRLALHFTGCHGPSVVAALAFTFAAARRSHDGQWQLSATGWMVPLILLLVVRHCRWPRLREGIGLGLALAALTVTSSYHGMMMALTAAVVLLRYGLVVRPSAARALRTPRRRLPGGDPPRQPVSFWPRQRVLSPPLAGPERVSRPRRVTPGRPPPPRRRRSAR